MSSSGTRKVHSIHCLVMYKVLLAIGGYDHGHHLWITLSSTQLSHSWSAFLVEDQASVDISVRSSMSEIPRTCLCTLGTLLTSNSLVPPALTLSHHPHRLIQAPKGTFGGRILRQYSSGTVASGRSNAPFFRRAIHFVSHCIQTNGDIACLNELITFI
jgi:hypothetical protein